MKQRMPVVIILCIILNLFYTPMNVYSNTISSIIPNRLSTSESHSLFINNDGTVVAWGDNSCGELGDGTNTGSLVPVQVLDLTNVISVSAGYRFSAALRNDGTVWTWGMGEFGRLGDGTEISKSRPAQISGINNVVAIAAVSNFTVALKNDGTVWAWGMNDKIGDGVYLAYKKAPVQVRDLVSIKAIAAGERHALALKEDGTVWAWGYNSSGELGDGTNIDRELPVQTNLLTSVKIIRANGRCSVAIKDDGTAWVWGDNQYGQLGDGTTISKNSPQQINVSGNIKDFSIGKTNSVIMKEDGTIWIWGDNTYGQVSDGTILPRLSPVQMSVAMEIITIITGGSHMLALKNDGSVWGWGDNTYGYPSKNYEFPNKLNNISDGDTVVIGANHFMVLKKDGTVWTWGDNSGGQLGDGTLVSKSSPTQVPGLNDVKFITAVNKTSFAVKNDGTVWAWGDNQYGILGNGTYTNSNIPVMINNFANIKTISASETHVLALKEDGTVFSWGANYSGQLGDGTKVAKTLPIQVPNLNNISTVFSNGEYSFAITMDGTIYGWGQRKYLSFTSQTSPLILSGFSNLKVIALTNDSNNDYICMLKNDNTVWKAILDLGNSNPTLTQMQDFIDIKSIIRTSVIKNDNTVWSWGDNSYGQLGDGTTISKASIVKTVSLTSVKSFSSNYRCSAAIEEDGSVWVWGNYNLDGIEVKTPQQITSIPTSSIVGVNGISLNLSSTIKTVGQTAQLTTTVEPANATDKSVSFSVYSQSGNNIVTVSASGLVAAMNPGTAVIRATSTSDSSKFGECTVTVNDDESPLLGSVEGIIKMEGKPDTNNLGVKIKIKDTNRETITDASGHFKLNGITPGPVTLVISKTKYLQREIANITISGSLVNTISTDSNYILLWAGDLDGDNGVGPSDLNVLISTYGKIEGQEGFNGIGDFDEKNGVGPSDLNILISHYGKTSLNYTDLP